MWRLSVCALVVLASACAPNAPPVTAQSSPAAGCPVTTPSGDRAPAEGSWPVNHKVGQLWVWVPGQALRLPPGPDGSFSIKVGWWRGVSGQLQIDGRRLDGSAPPVRAEIPDGYGPIGFQSSGIIFPTAGCWEVTGRVGDERLTFVDEIVNALP